MTIEKLQEAQKILGKRTYHKGNLDRLIVLRDDSDVAVILRFLSSFSFYTEKSAEMVLNILENEIKACEEEIEKYNKMFNDL